jgi:hypothetical protein
MEDPAVLVSGHQELGCTLAAPRYRTPDHNIYLLHVLLLKRCIPLADTVVLDDH